MKLYYSPGACSLAADIAFREAGLSIELEKVTLKDHITETGEDYYQINPKGYVPALRLDDGSILTENSAIATYIADQNPTAKLAPAAGTIERYRLEEWLGYLGTEVHKNFSTLFRNPSDEEKEKTFAKIDKRLKHIEDTLSKQQFLMGHIFTVADCYAFAILRWAPGRGVVLPERVTEYMERIAVRPHVKAALDFEGLVYPPA